MGGFNQRSEDALRDVAERLMRPSPHAGEGIAKDVQRLVGRCTFEGTLHPRIDDRGRVAVGVVFPGAMVRTRPDAAGERAVPQLRL